MKRTVDTACFRAAIRRAFSQTAKADTTPKYDEHQGVDLVPADDRELLGESVHPTHTVRHWGKWIYQKRESGKWDKLVPSQRKKAKR